MDAEVPSDAGEKLCVFCRPPNPDTAAYINFTFTMRRGGRGGEKYQDIPCHRGCYASFQRQSRLIYPLINIALFTGVLYLVYRSRMDLSQPVCLAGWLGLSIVAGWGSSHMFLTAEVFKSHYGKWLAASGKAGTSGS